MRVGGGLVAWEVENRLLEDFEVEGVVEGLTYSRDGGDGGFERGDISSDCLVKFFALLGILLSFKIGDIGE